MLLCIPSPCSKNRMLQRRCGCRWLSISQKSHTSGISAVDTYLQSYEAALGSYSLSVSQLVAEGSNPNEAWTRAAERQKRCLATAVARERALVPSAVKKRPQTPKATASAANVVSPSAANVVSPSVPGSVKSEQQSQQPLAGSVGSSPQKALQPSPAAVAVSSELAATPETGRTAVKPESEQPAANGTHAVAHNHVDSSPPNARTPAANETTQKVKLVVKQIASATEGKASKGSPHQASPLQGHANDAGVPPELTKLEKRLIRAESLAGVWGAERFGFADTTVLLVRDPNSLCQIQHRSSISHASASLRPIRHR